MGKLEGNQPSAEALGLASSLSGINNLIVAILGEMQVDFSTAVLSRRILQEIVIHHRRDMRRLGEDHGQGQQVALTKRVSNLAFWVRRLKPLSGFKPAGGGEELQDINEQVAIQFACRLLILAAADPRCKIFSRLNVNDVHKKFEMHLRHFWQQENYANYTNLVYTIRYREWSPYQFTHYLDSILTGFALRLSRLPS